MTDNPIDLRLAYARIRELLAYEIAARFGRRPLASMALDALDLRPLIKSHGLIPPAIEGELTVDAVYEAADGILLALTKADHIIGLSQGEGETFQAGWSAGFAEGMSEGTPGYAGKDREQHWREYLDRLTPSEPGLSLPGRDVGSPRETLSADLSAAREEARVANEQYLSAGVGTDSHEYEALLSANRKVRLLKAALSPPISGDAENVAWDWLDTKFRNTETGSVPEDRDYSADEMVDAFLAGRACLSTPSDGWLEAKAQARETEPTRETRWFDVTLPERYRVITTKAGAAIAVSTRSGRYLWISGEWELRHLIGHDGCNRRGRSIHAKTAIVKRVLSAIPSTPEPGK